MEDASELVAARNDLLLVVHAEQVRNVTLHGYIFREQAGIDSGLLHRIVKLAIEVSGFCNLRDSMLLA